MKKIPIIFISGLLLITILLSSFIINGNNLYTEISSNQVSNTWLASQKSKNVDVNIKESPLNKIYTLLSFISTVKDTKSESEKLKSFHDDTKDADNDEINDEWEIIHFGDTDRDGKGDMDRDGLYDSEEYLLDTDPNNPFSGGRIKAVFT
ncbi:MAG: hypothetical protein QXS02_02625 [Candidatus Thermoplasmatota archaeon]